MSVDDDLVVLDTNDDAYLCFPGLGPLDGRRVPSGSAFVALLAADLILDRQEPHPYPVRLVPPLPLRSCRAFEPTGVKAADAVSLGVTWLILSTRRPGIGDLAQLMGPRPELASDPGALAKRVETFRAVTPCLPWIGECLFQSWLLLTWLRRNGLDATWVFGVRLRPFAAHCWLQSDDLALTDAPETLSAYHPILAV